jgi:stress-induced-phosphoprotein 1
VRESGGGRPFCPSIPSLFTLLPNLLIFPQLRADYTLIAKVLDRIGSSYAQKSDLVSAIKYFQKSLTEHRTSDVLTKLREVEKQQAEVERAAYVDPAKSAEEREAGNERFKQGDFAELEPHIFHFLM